MHEAGLAGQGVVFKGQGSEPLLGGPPQPTPPSTGWGGTALTQLCSPDPYSTFLGLSFFICEMEDNDACPFYCDLGFPKQTKLPEVPGGKSAD